MEKQRLLNTYISNTDMENTVGEVEALIRLGKKSYVVAINVDVIMKIEHDPYLKEIIDKANIALVDGKPLLWIARLHGRPVKTKISGSDLVPLLCEMAAQKGLRIFILGGKEGVAKRAKKNLEAGIRNINIAGVYSPPFGFEKNQRELEKINKIISDAAPDLLITCFGCPKQEKFVYENFQKYNAIVSVCAGATVDFLAGNVKRAPGWMSDHGFEWFYRFLQEPRRLFKRYFIDDIKILKLVVKYR